MKTTTNYFGHFQDLADAWVGPFDSEDAVRAHAKWCKEVRGDGGELLEIVTSVPVDAEDIGIVLTPAEDKADGLPVIDDPNK